MQESKSRPGGEVRTCKERRGGLAKVLDWSEAGGGGGNVTSQSDEGGVGHEAMV